MSYSLGAGLSAGLGYWSLLSLFQGIAPQQVEEQDQRVFNQGIRRSLRNSLAMGILSGGVIWEISILMVGLSEVLRSRLGYWLGCYSFVASTWSYDAL